MEKDILEMTKRLNFLESEKERHSEWLKSLDERISEFDVVSTLLTHDEDLLDKKERLELFNTKVKELHVIVLNIKSSNAVKQDAIIDYLCRKSSARKTDMKRFLNSAVKYLPELIA